MSSFRYAARTLLKTPGFSIVAIATIALGIAANTTVFAVINTLFLNPLPVGCPHELVTVRTTVEGTPPGEALAISRLNLEDIRARNAGVPRPRWPLVADGSRAHRRRYAAASLGVRLTRSLGTCIVSDGRGPRLLQPILSVPLGSRGPRTFAMHLEGCGGRPALRSSRC